jgi:hypothetical protein
VRRVALLSVFVLGGTVGAAGILFLDMRMRPTYRRTLQSTFLAEQDLLAARTAREGDQLRSLVHRWNAVEASSEEGFRIFRVDPEIDDGLFLPFILLGLKYIGARADPSGRGARVGEGLERGKLALALERLGAPTAEEQWRRAQDLLRPRTLEDVRRAVDAALEVEHSDVEKQAEAVVLDHQRPPASGRQ